MYDKSQTLVSQIYTIFITNLSQVYGLLCLSCCLGWSTQFWYFMIRQKHTPSPSLEGSNLYNNWILGFEHTQPYNSLFYLFLESLNLPFQEGSSACKNWNLPFDCAQGDLLWDFYRSNVPSPDGSGNPLARVAIFGQDGKSD